MDRLKEPLSRLSDLSDSELQELRSLVLGMIDKGNSDPSKTYSTIDGDELSILASAATAVRAEMDRREVMAAQRHENEATLREFASNAMTVPAGRAPVAGRPSGAVTALTAAGMPVNDADGITEALADALNTARLSSGADGDRSRAATIRWSRPADRTLHGNEHPDDVARLLAEASAQHSEQVSQTLVEQPEAMTAAGGFQTARQPVYDLPGFESSDRPVRTALPSFTTTRGGVSFTMPPVLSDLNGATSIWTVQNDIDAATNPAVRKPAVRVLPGATVTADLQAIVSQVVYGNLISRANPEWVRRVMQLAMAHSAVVAEQQLLTQIGSLSKAVTGAANGLGATRQLLPVLERGAAAIRNRGRMAADAPLQVFLPAWTRNLLRADLTAQEPGDAVLGVSNSELSLYLSVRGLAVTYALDGEAGQAFGTQAASSALADFPANVVAYMFPAGAFVFADGGTLDLGIVRDSALNAANDYVVFSESFECVLHRAGEALRITVPVSASGVSRAAA